MPAARDALLDDVVGYVAAHGMSDLSLRELAGAIGSSHRMLIYHFGSRAGLVAAVAAAVEEQQRAAMVQLAAGASSPAALIEAVWRQVSDPELRPFVRLFFEVLGWALQHRPGTEDFLRHLTEPWIERGQDAAAELGTEASLVDLRLGVAVVRGLLVDVLATGDDAAATAALQRFVVLWEAAPPAP